jgi:hypothetical protein
MNVRIEYEIDSYDSPLRKRIEMVEGECVRDALRDWMLANGYDEERYLPDDSTDSRDATNVRAFIGLRSYGRPAWAEATIADLAGDHIGIEIEES